MIVLVKNKTSVLAMEVSNSGEMVAMYCRDRVIRVFRIADGKLLTSIDETLQTYIDDQSNMKANSHQLLDKLDFERRLALERDLDKHWDYSER